MRLPLAKFKQFSMVVLALVALTPTSNTALAADSSAELAAKHPALLTLKGELTPGGLIIGKAKPGSSVWFNDKLLRLTTDGEFVFGFGRDDTLEQSLTIQSPAGNKQQIPLTLAKRDYKIDRIEGVAKKYVSPPKKVLDRIKDDNRQIGAARATDSDRLDFLQTFIKPAKGRISGVYGSQRFFNGKPKNPHYGLDIANKTGSPVYAPVAGKVLVAHNDMYYSGGTLIIDHGYGVTSTFIHLHKILVKPGDVVEQGDVIAQIGATGRVTGPHLDWRINWFNVRLDPALVLDTLDD